MEGKDLVNIDVKIAGRSYPLKVKNEDEKHIMRIVREVNDKVDHFQKMYTSKDKQDCLSMALLTYAVDLHKKQSHSEPEQAQENAQQQQQINDKIDQLDELLDFLLL